MIFKSNFTRWDKSGTYKVENLPFCSFLAIGSVAEAGPKS